jgi:hypothetical protein
MAAISQDILNNQYGAANAKYNHTDSVESAGSSRRKTDLVLNTFTVIVLSTQSF